MSQPNRERYCRALGQWPIVILTPTAAAIFCTQHLYSLIAVSQSGVTICAHVLRAKMKGLPAMPRDIFAGDPVLLACDNTLTF